MSMPLPPTACDSCQEPKENELDDAVLSSASRVLLIGRRLWCPLTRDASVLVVGRGNDVVCRGSCAGGAEACLCLLGLPFCEPCTPCAVSDAAAERDFERRARGSSGAAELNDISVRKLLLREREDDREEWLANGDLGESALWPSTVSLPCAAPRMRAANKLGLRGCPSNLRRLAPA